MSIEQKNVVDFISFDKNNNKVILTISDHLPWDDEYMHLSLLQDKINAYIGFIERGEIFKKYPEYKNKTIVISICFKYDITNTCIDFLEKVRNLLHTINVKLEFRKLE